MHFPATMPADCPLPGSIACNTVVYIIVKNNPAISTDCLTQAERNRATTATGEGACTRHGLSVFPSLQDCQHHRSLFKAFAGGYIAKASLTSEHGQQRNTPSQKAPAHMTWWPYEHISRHELFEVIGDA